MSSLKLCRLITTTNRQIGSGHVFLAYKNGQGQVKCFSTTTQLFDRINQQQHKLVIVGAGSGGLAVAAKFAKKINPKDIAIVEPADVHYYQPLWTLVGGGIKSLQESARPMKSLLPQNVTHYFEKVVQFEPKQNQVTLSNGESIKYEFMVIAIGIQLRYDQVKGLEEALKTPGSGVCSNYSSLHVEKTFQCLENFKKGNAIFTFPNSMVKCPGAPQKILYLAEDFLTQNGKRKEAHFIYNTSLPVIFGVKKYADSLWNVVKQRDIEVNLRQNLVEVIPEKKQAVFQNLDEPKQLKTVEYELLHVTPPMGPYDVLKSNSDLSDVVGLLNVKKDTLQHQKYENIFGLGDCTNSPNSKTAAAAASQSLVVFRNLCDVMNNTEPTQSYNGYASCPLITSSKTCILAEFDYNLQPLETFPFDQGKERRSMYHLKKDFMPYLYWNYMTTGRWNGPGTLRKMLHFGMSK